MSKAPRAGRRVSAAVRRARVLRLKMTGASDRDIAQQLAMDAQEPVKVSHVQVNRDWHAALKQLWDDHKEEAQQLRMLVAMRLERVIMAYWSRAVGEPLVPLEPDDPLPEPDKAAAKIVLDATAHYRALFGLDRELGDAERPIQTETRVGAIDFNQLTEEELDFFITVLERQRPALPPGPDGDGPQG